MKRGISLIVLVITIIVMIILAAAIIISISNSNVINKANQAVEDTNIATIKEAAALKFADVTLKMKEDGDNSILGGKTVGEYIEQQLINDGTMKKSDAVIFTTNGGVYGPNEYNSIPDKDEARDWRYINGKLYYFGTDIDKRIALKDNADINTDYILLNMKSEAYTLSDLTGYQGRIKSFKEIFNEGEGSYNQEFTPASITYSDDITLVTGTRLYLSQNYVDELAMVIVSGDVTFEGTIFNVSAGVCIGIARNQERLDDYYEYELGGWVRDEEMSNLPFIMNTAADIDMDNIVTEKEGSLLRDLARDRTNGTFNTNLGKKISDMNFYSLANIGNTTEIFSKSWYDANFNTDKVVNNWPADIAK